MDPSNDDDNDGRDEKLGWIISEDGTIDLLLMLVLDDDVVNANEEVVAKAATTNKSKAARPPLLFIVVLLLLFLSIMYDGRSQYMPLKQRWGVGVGCVVLLLEQSKKIDCCEKRLRS